MALVKHIFDKMKFYFCMAGILLCILSCNQNDPSIETTESYYFYKDGDRQMGVAGEYLENELSVTYYPDANNMDAKIQVHFEVTSGGGSVDSPNQALSPQIPFVSTKWKIGTHSTNQSVTAHMYDQNGKHLTDLIYSSWAFQAGKWDTVYNSPDRFFTMARDMVHKKTYIIKDSRLFVQGDHYFKWNIVESFQDKICRSVKVDSKGTIYVVVESGELFKSVNQGESFVRCTHPFPERNYLSHLNITYNDYLWVNNSYSVDDVAVYAWRYSTDCGQTWISTDLKRNSNFADIYRLSDDSFITADWRDGKYILYQSKNGVNWLPISEKFPTYPMGIFVSEKDEIIVYGKGYDASIIIYKSTDLLKTFSGKYSIPIEWSSSANFFEKFNDTYYMCFPGGGAFKTKDFENFDIVLKNTSLNDLMIDHNGVLFLNEEKFLNENKPYTMYIWKDKD